MHGSSALLATRQGLAIFRKSWEAEGKAPAIRSIDNEMSQTDLDTIRMLGLQIDFDADDWCSAHNPNERGLYVSSDGTILAPKQRPSN